MPNNRDGNKKHSNAPRPSDRGISRGVSDFKSKHYNKMLRFDIGKQCSVNYREWLDETKTDIGISNPLVDQVFEETDWRPLVIDPNAAIYQVDPHVVGAANIRAEREDKSRRLRDDEKDAKEENRKMYLERKEVFGKIIKTLSDESKQLVETHPDYRISVENRNNVEAKNPFELLRVTRETHIISQNLGNSVDRIREDFQEKLINSKRATKEKPLEYLTRLKSMWTSEQAWVNSHPMAVVGVVPPLVVPVPINTIEKYTHNFMQQVGTVYQDAYVDYTQRTGALVSPALESAYDFVTKFVTKESLGLTQKTKGDEKAAYAVRKDISSTKEAMKKQAKKDRGKGAKPGAAAGAGAGGGQGVADPCLVCKWYLEKAEVTSTDLSTIRHFKKGCPYSSKMSYSSLPQDFRDRNPTSNSAGSKKRKSRDAKALATVLDDYEDDSEDDRRHGKKHKA